MVNPEIYGQSPFIDSGTIGFNMGIDQTSINSEIKSSNIKKNSSRLKHSKDLFIELKKEIELNSAWKSKNKKGSFNIKQFGNDSTEINKFKFQIRKNLKSKNLLFIVHSIPVLHNLLLSLQLSEKLEPQSFQNFLKATGMLNPKTKTKLHISKMQLKKETKEKDKYRNQLRKTVTGYLLETWIEKKLKSYLHELMKEKIEKKLQEIDELSKADDVQGKDSEMNNDINSSKIQEVQSNLHSLLDSYLAFYYVKNLSF